jgi:hypothetical protein
MRRKRWLAALCSAGVLGLAMAPALAQDRVASLQGRQAASSGAAPGHVQDAYTLDPFMQAIIIAMAARILREAAASPDPVAALAESVERSVVAALANPETARLVEALTGHAFKDVPEELRQAIVAFAVSA